MKSIVKQDAVLLNESYWPINASKQGCFLQILEQTHHQLTAMLSYHSKVLVVNFVLFLREPETNNSSISRLMKKLRKWFDVQKRQKRFSYVWVREISKSEGIHYHLSLFLNGNKFRSFVTVRKMIALWWNQTWSIGSVGIRSSARMIQRKDLGSFKDALYHLSYLAKVRTKGKRPSSTNDYSTGRLKARDEV